MYLASQYLPHVSIYRLTSAYNTQRVTTYFMCSSPLSYTEDAKETKTDQYPAAVNISKLYLYTITAIIYKHMYYSKQLTLQEELSSLLSTSVSGILF